MKFRVIFLVIMVATVILTGPALPAREVVASEMSELRPMIKLNLTDLNGKKINSDTLKGNILLLDFWATWCGPCIREIPSLNELEARYGPRGLKVIGVTLASGEAKVVKPLVARNKMNYAVLMGDDDQTYDLNIQGYPTTYLVTRDWKVYRTYVGGGATKMEQVQADIEKILNGEAN